MIFAPLKFAFTLLALGITALPTLAATVGASFNVSVTVVSGCQVTVPTMAGAYAAAKVTASSVLIACTNPTAYNVKLATEPAIGTIVSSVTGAVRNAAGSTSNVPGNGLLPGLAQTVSWTPAVGRGAMNGTGRGFFEPHTVYGESARAQSSASGQRANLIVVTVTY